MGPLEQISEEAGYGRRKQKVVSPKFISVQRVTLLVSLTHAEA
jgi:hypothetical protein